MQRTRFPLAIAAALAAMGAAPAAHAADDLGPYLVIGGGQSSFNEDCTGLSNCDKTGNAFKIVGGYGFGGGLAAEVLVLNFGKASASGSGVSVELKADAVGLGGAFRAPVGADGVLGVRLGVARVKVKLEGRAGSTVLLTESESSTKAYAGLFGAYRFTPTVSAELAFDSTQGKFDGQSETIRAITIGVGIKF
jgi:OmpA-OmpF porin, OOP family